MIVMINTLCVIASVFSATYFLCIIVKLFKLSMYNATISVLKNSTNQVFFCNTLMINKETQLLLSNTRPTANHL